MPYDSSTMRVALFGGTFDPPHRGHIALARLARKRLSLDRILVAPVAAQPLKHHIYPASFDDRVAMARRAFARQPGIEISLIDAPRADGSSNYTIDTLAQLRRQFSPSDQLFCILGADSLLGIRNWHHPADLLLACDFIIGARPGFDLTQTTTALPDGISAKQLPTNLPHTELLELTGPGDRTSHLYLLLDLAENVSATEIRAHIHAALQGNVQLRSILAPSVTAYIRAHHLYQHL
jgi:nicotinate-nucleotide adenylyltransferase